MIELNADGTVKEGGIMNRTTISLEFLKNEAAKALLVGKAAGDEVTVDPHAVSDGHDDLARMLGVDHDRVHHLAGNFLFRIDSIKRMAAAEMGQEFFDRVFGQGAVPDEAAFRAKVKESLQNGFGRDTDRIFTREVLKALYDRTTIELRSLLVPYFDVSPDQEIQQFAVFLQCSPVKIPEFTSLLYNQFATVRFHRSFNRLVPADGEAGTPAGDSRCEPASSSCPYFH